MEGKEFYIYGNAEGEWPSWYDNGKSSSLGEWRNGRKTGLWKYWDHDGQIKTEVNYTDTGNTRTDFYPTGQKRSVGTFIGTGKIGSWVYWDPNGTVKAQCDFGEGLFALPSKACQLIADNLEPKGFSPPMPVAMKADESTVRIRIASLVFEVTAPAGWVADTMAGKKDHALLVFYPRGSAWRKPGPNMYLETIFKGGRSFEKTVEDEKDTFQERVAEYHEEISDRGQQKSGVKYVVKNLRYKPVIETDSPFSIVSENVIHESVAYVDISDKVALITVLACDNASQLKQFNAQLIALINSLQLQSQQEIHQ